VLVAEALRRQNYHITCVGAADLADPALASICQDFEWFGWGRARSGVAAPAEPAEEAKA